MASRLAGRVFIDGLPSHMTFDAGPTVFITLQQSGRLAAFDLATQTVKWNVPVGNTPADVVMLPDDKRLLVALTGEDGIVVIDAKDGTHHRQPEDRQGRTRFLAKGDRRTGSCSNRVEGTVSLVDTQDMKVVGTIKVPGGPDCMDITARRQGTVGDATVPASSRGGRYRADQGRCQYSRRQVAARRLHAEVGSGRTGAPVLLPADRLRAVSTVPALRDRPSAPMGELTDLFG